MFQLTEVLKKTISVLLTAVIMVCLFTSLGAVALASATDGQELQQLIDDTPRGGTLTLKRDYKGTRNGWGYSEEVVISKPITIQGKAPNNRAQIDNITLVIEAANVTLKNLRCESGDNPHGLFVHASNGVANGLHIKNCIFNTEGNYNAFANSGKSNDGGHLYLANISDLRIEKCQFKNGRAEYTAGAIHMKQVDGCELIDCKFTGNIARRYGNNGSAIAGAVFSKGSKNVSFEECIFTENTAGQAGGAVYVKNGSNFDFNNCTFTKNDCTPAATVTYDQIGKGGALAFINSVRCKVTHCTFTQNAAYTGGGIYAAKSDLNVNESDFIQNSVKCHLLIDPELLRSIFELGLGLDPQDFIQALIEYCLTEICCPGVQFDDFLETTNRYGGEGGGIYAIASSLKVNESEFADNVAKKSGAGVYMLGSKQVKDAYITSCYFLRNEASSGGAITNMTSGALIRDCLIESNKAEAGGGIYSGADCTVSNTQFIGNSAKAGGAVIANLIDNTQTFEDCTFKQNGAGVTNRKMGGAGGAIHAFGAEKNGNNEDVKIADCRIFVKGSDFTQNYAQSYGGALSLHRVEATAQDNVFMQNRSDSLGGAVYSDEKSKTIVQRNKFDRNVAEEGGAIFSNYAKCYVYRSEFTSNEGVSGAGAIADNEGRIEALNCLFTGNKTDALLQSGSVFDFHGTDEATVTNCTIVDNYTTNTKPQNYMCAIYGSNRAKAVLRNNILLSNTRIETTGIFDIFTIGMSMVDAKYNICALSGEGNIKRTTDIFLDYGNRDYHLRYDFPNGGMGAVEQGTNEVFTQKIDLDGAKRVVDADGDGIAKPDLGAYEATHVRVTFKDSHPRTIARGSVSGDTEQWVQIGQPVDVSSVTVTPKDGWVFNYWENLSHERVDLADAFNVGETLYARYKRE